MPKSNERCHEVGYSGWCRCQKTIHTIAKVLKEPVDQAPKKRDRKSAIDVFAAQVSAWLDQQLPVIRMLELARTDSDHPYRGSETAFYDYVRKVRRARQPSPREVALRFEGMPGEFLRGAIGARCATCP